MAKTRILPSQWMPKAKVEAVVVHWTAGTRSVSTIDQQHYHFIIPDSCQVERGKHSITANQTLVKGKYAAHVKDFNAFNGKAVIGVSLCGMDGAKESPFQAGPFPITEEQWKCAARVVADLCECYNISVDDQHVLQHGEVEENRGIKQNGKWDINKLPWAPNLTKKQVHDQFRQMVTDALTQKARDIFPEITVSIDGKNLPVQGLLLPGRSLVPVKALLAHFKWTAKSPSLSSITLISPGGPVAVAFEIHDSEGFVPATSLALALDWPRPAFNLAALKLSLTTK